MRSTEFSLIISSISFILNGLWTYGLTNLDHFFSLSLIELTDSSTVSSKTDVRLICSLVVIISFSTCKTSFEEKYMSMILSSNNLVLFSFSPTRKNIRYVYRVEALATNIRKEEKRIRCIGLVFFFIFRKNKCTLCYSSVGKNII